MTATVVGPAGNALWSTPENIMVASPLIEGINITGPATPKRLVREASFNTTGPAFAFDNVSKTFDLPGDFGYVSGDLFLIPAIFDMPFSFS
jgi:hypothetical protein